MSEEWFMAAVKLFNALHVSLEPRFTEEDLEGGRVERAKAASARTYARHLARVRALKDAGCMDCGAPGVEGSTATALHFHHRDPSTKKFAVGAMSGQPDERFYAEVAKCDPVCPPCHRARHKLLRAGALAAASSYL